MAQHQAKLSGPDLTQGIALDELADGGKLLGHAADEQVLLVRRGTELFAVGAQCTHYHAPLVDGLVVDDTDAVRKALAHAGIQPLPGPFLDFLDPWGNRIEIVGYDNIQFTKAPNVLRGMGLTHLSKNEKAIKELTEKGMAPN